MEPKVHHAVHKTPPVVHIHNHRDTHIHLLQIHYSIILPSHPQVQTKMAAAETLLTCIWEVHVLSLGHNTNYPDTSEVLLWSLRQLLG